MRIRSITRTIFVAVLMLSCTVVYAQPSQPTDPNSPGFKSHRHHQMGGGIGMLNEKLGLTAAQQASIKEIFIADANQIKAIRDNNSLSKEQKQAEIKAIRQKGIQDVNSILTPAQQQEFAQLKKHAFHQQHGRHWDRLAILSNKLDLTADQKTSIKAIFAADANEIKAVRQNSSLSKEQKMTEIKAIWQKGIQDVNSILTPPQQQEFAQLKQKGMSMGNNRMRSGHKWQHGQTPPDSNS